jgi:hypothetical protein
MPALVNSRVGSSPGTREDDIGADRVLLAGEEIEEAAADFGGMHTAHAGAV